MNTFKLLLASITTASANQLGLLLQALSQQNNLQNINVYPQPYLLQTQLIEAQALISDWDNELPLLVYHGIKESCSVDHVTLVLQAVQDMNQATGKNIYAECLIVKNRWGADEVTTSIITGLPWQAEQYCSQVQNHPVFGKSDFNILAMSQGGQVSRDMIQDCDLGSYKVRNYLSAGGPQMGVSMEPGCFTGFWCELLNKIENYLGGWSVAQKFLAPAAYWNDPTPKVYAEMLEKSVYLPYINNLKYHDKYDQYKARFSALNRIELVKFGNDQVIYPVISTQFGTQNDDGDNIPMTQTSVFTQNTIGLKDLYNAGKVYLYTIPGAGHLDFTLDNINNNFLPFLYARDFTAGQQQP